MQGKRRAVVMLEEFDPILSPAEEKWLLGFRCSANKVSVPW